MPEIVNQKTNLFQRESFEDLIISYVMMVIHDLIEIYFDICSSPIQFRKNLKLHIIIPTILYLLSFAMSVKSESVISGKRLQTDFFHLNIATATTYSYDFTFPNVPTKVKNHIYQKYKQ